MRIELVASIVFFIFSGVIFFVSTGYSAQAAVFPKALSVILGILAAIYFLQVLKNKVVPQNFAGYPLARIVAFLVALVLYFVCLNYLGFYTASFAYYLVLTLGLSKDKLSKKEILVTFCSASVFIGVLYFLFSGLLKVQIPSGFLI